MTTSPADTPRTASVPPETIRPSIWPVAAINLNGLNNASSSVQTLGALTSTSGQGTLNVTRNSNNGNPTLTFGSLTISSGSP
jgi:hypothetical protein